MQNILVPLFFLELIFSFTFDIYYMHTHTHTTTTWFIDLRIGIVWLLFRMSYFLSHLFSCVLLKIHF